MSNYQTNSISFQVAINLDLPECAFVTYKDLTGQNVTGEKVNIGLRTFDGIWVHSYCHYQSGKIYEDLQLEFDFSTNTDPLKPDTDGDGLTDGHEVNDTHTNPCKADEDDDGLTDSEEILNGTNPRVADTDGDELPDGWEVKNGLNPCSAVGDDGAYGDPDHDGLTNREEQIVGGNPLSSDTDSDGVTDSEEILYGTNVSKADTDNDGLTDGEEIDAGYDPTDPDMDRDGLPDGWEDDNGTNPLSNSGDDGANGDPDGDGLHNIDEYKNGTDPTCADTDGDGVSDGEEVRRGADPTDASDHGQPRPENEFRTIEFNINGDFATWEMKIVGLGPKETRTRRITMASPNASETENLRLRKGNTYQLSMRWLNCDGHDDDWAPWYCWQAKLDDQPVAQSYVNYSDVRRPGNEVIIGTGWYADNKDGLLSAHVHVSTKYYDDDFGGGNVAGSLIATLYVLEDPKLIPDYNRDGIINSADEKLAGDGKTFRFWVNDDADNLATGGKYAEDPEIDIPGGSNAGGRKPDYNDENVNGYSDLLDFTPVFMDISSLRNLPEEVFNKLTFKLKHNDGAINVVWTGLAKGSAGNFLKNEVNSCGRNLDEKSVYAATEQVNASGVEIPRKLIDEMKSNSSDKGVCFLEGRTTTQSPLKLEVYYEYHKIATGELDLSLSLVEDMYYRASLRNFQYPTHHNAPGNDCAEPNAKNVVFLHGYHVDENEARAWQSEMFKRLWQSGANMRFWGVTWNGNAGSPTAFHYQDNVYNAFLTAPSLTSLVFNQLSGPTIILAHSLGNMVVSSAIEDYGLEVSKYFMLNSAVPSEAYNSSLHNASPNNVLVHEEWRNYLSKTWASEWHTLFPPSDDRSKLTWKNRFSHVSGNVYNYFSTGDEVLELFNRTPDPWEGGMLNKSTKGRYAWHKQESYKGRGENVILDWATTDWSGWGFRENILGLKMYTAEQANALDPTKLRTNTVFTLYPSTMNRSVISRQHLNENLAKGIPALSPAAGARSINRPGYTDYDINTGDMFKGNGWWRTTGKLSNRWLHSDIKDAAYFFVYKLFDKLIQDGDLR